MVPGCHRLPHVVAVRRLLAVVFVCLVVRTTGADTVRFLPGNVESFQTRLDLMASAEQRLDVVYFWVDQDTISRQFLETLREAAERGVRVRFVVDDLHNKMSAAQQVDLLLAGVEIRVFHPRGNGLRTLLHRMHDKFLAADQKRMIVGSRNIEDGYYGASSPCLSYVDIDCLVEGAVVADACGYFEQLWASCHIVPLRACEGIVAGAWQPPKHGGVAQEYPWLEGCLGKLGSPTFEIESKCLDFVHDYSGSKTRGCGIAPDLYRVLDSAQHSIVLVTPYFLPANELGHVIRRALDRGVHVCVLTNSMQSTNRPIQYAGLLNVSKRYTRKGLDIREFGGPETMHAKAFVIDGCIAGVTSFNFNRRSAMTDTEVGLVIYDSLAAQHLEATLWCLFQKSSPHVPAGLGGRLAYRRGAKARGETPIKPPSRLPRTNKGERVGVVRVRALRAGARLIPRQL
jgi:putative cardiolipin synthase